MLKQHFLTLVFFIFIFILIISTYQDYGLPWDEKIFFNTGKYYAINTLDFLRLPHNLSNNGFAPTPYHIKGHGVFSDVLIVFASLPFRNFNFESLHLLRALSSLPIFILVYWIVSRLLSKSYGFISLVFLLLFPRFYPEIFYNAVDVPTTLFFTISLSYFIYYAQSKQTFLKSIIFGLILAVTINQRLLLFYLPIVNFFFLLVGVILNEVKRSEGSSQRSERQNAYARFFAEFTLSLSKVLRMTKWGNFFANQLTIFISTIFFLHLTNPYLLSHPIVGLFEIVQSTKQYPWNADVLFNGRFYQAGFKPLPWYYLLKSMLITIPPLTTVLFFIGNFRILSYSLFTKMFPIRSRPSTIGNWIPLYVLFIFYFPIILTFIFKPTLYDSWRQFLFLTIPIIIIAMLGLEWIWSTSHSGERKRVQNRSSEQRFRSPLLPSMAGFEGQASRNDKIILFFKFIIGAWIFISLGFTVAKMINLHPLEYLYYNSLVGGLKGAYGKYETDYWGLGFKEAVLWFKQNINDPKKTYKIYVEGDPLSSSYYFKPNMQLTNDPVKADYIFTFTRWNFHLRHPGKTIYTVERDGVPLIFIKKL